MQSFFKNKTHKGGQRAQYSRTKIIATLGPASDSEAIVERLLKEGVDGFRLNLSHGKHEDQLKRIRWVRSASKKHDSLVSIIADLQGPKIRLGDLAQPVNVHTGETIRLAYQADFAKTGIVPIQHDFSKKVKAGERLLINDGKIVTTVMQVRNGVISVEVQSGGVLSSRKGINLPDTDLQGDIITNKDLADIKFAVENGLDYIALSFVQSGQDVSQLRKYLKQLGGEAIKVIAKIETRQAANNLEQIIAVSDAVMVARGDLATETEPESVPVLQRKITGLCLRDGKVSIIATQMLASMTDSLQPTRAEVSDVATAVITSADCVMLSEETAAGKYPLEAVKMMSKIVNYAEKNSPVKPLYMKMEDHSRQGAISSAVVTLAEQMKAQAIVAETMSGMTARTVADRRPTIPILMVSNNEQVARQLAIVYGGVSLYRPATRSAGEKLPSWLKKRGLVKKGDIIVIAAGKHAGVIGGTDTIKVRAVH